MSFNPEHLIYCGHTTEAPDIFHSLRTGFSDAAFLVTEACKDLEQELAQEDPQTVLEQLGKFAAPHGHMLCSADDGSDGYLLCLVNATGLEALQAYCRAEDFGVEIFGRKVVTKRATQPKVAKAAKVNLVVDSLHFEYLFHSFGNTPIAEVAVRSEIAGRSGRQSHIADFSHWPPRLYPGADHTRYEAVMSLSESEHMLIARGKSDFVLHRLSLGEEAIATHPWSGRLAMGDYFYLAAGADSVYHAFHGSKHTTLQKVSGQNTETLFTAQTGRAMGVASHPDGGVCVIGSRKLFFGGGVELPLPEPATHLSSCFMPDARTVCYFSERPRTPKHEDWPPEMVLVLNTCDVASANIYSLPLDGFVSHGKINGEAFHSFDGSVVVSRAADGWWIVNYVTSQFGKRDVAWLWNARTHKLLRVEPRFLPVKDVVLHYVAPLHRVVAVEHNDIHLLLAFDAFIAHLTAVG